MDQKIQSKGSIPVNGDITKVTITRAFSHNQRVASPGHVWYKFSYTKMEPGKHTAELSPVKYKGAVQLSLAYEESVGEEEVKEYIRKKYIQRHG